MDILGEAATEEALRRLPGWQRTGDLLAHRIEGLVGDHGHPPGLAGLS
jgi:hypothetical protein